MSASEDATLRLAALTRLEALVDELGPELSRAQLRNVLSDVSPPHLVDRQKGIWNPNWLDATLSVLTTHDSEYSDEELGTGVWAYSYRDGSVEGDNRKLRAAYDMGVDLVYFRPGLSGLYQPIFPVRVVENYPDKRQVILVRRDIDRVDWQDGQEESLRRWAETTIMRRLHQDEFRKHVMRTYEGQCAVCNLKYESLLDAAHIDRDKSEHGEPHVNNGLALCGIHHRAYDTNLMGITPHGVVNVQKRLREDTDGPMLLHGIQEMHGRKLWLPRNVNDRPLHERLERRYREFKAARL
jgi:putative restriction endonuclease